MVATTSLWILTFLLLACSVVSLLESAMLNTDPSKIPPCIDKAPDCPHRANNGQCNQYRSWMTLNCPLSCNVCELMDPRKRCTAEAMNLTLTPAYQPGDMDRIFYGMKDKYKDKYNVTYISEDPWVVAVDGFMSDLEIKMFLRIVDRWYDLQSDEYAANSQRDSSGRKGFVSWCTTPKCLEASIAKTMYQRMSDLVQIPATNFEQFQILKYEPGTDQEFPTHHDYNAPDRVFPCRTRIMTCFLYMSDVTEGGETVFVDLPGIKVQPRKGRLGIWVNSLNSAPYEREPRTTHWGIPVIAGMKYGANSGVHIHDFRGPFEWECTWTG